MKSLLDLANVRDFLRERGDAEAPIDSLEVSYMQAGPDGPMRVVYEGPARNGSTFRVTGRRTNPAKEGEQLLFQIFPADDRLPTLPAAIDESAMTPILESALAPYAERARLRRVCVHVMRYKPGRKCLLRYDLSWAAGAGPGAPSVAWARVSRAAKFARTRDNLARIHAAAAQNSFELPQPLGVVPRLQMELFGAVAGVALFALVRRAEFPALCRRVGELLHGFHRLNVRMETDFDAAAQIERLHENATEFAWLLPAERPRIAAIDRELTVRLLAAPRSPLLLIHRDFHGDNVLVAGDRISLIDFEDCAMGDPLDDVGSNWAQLTWWIRKAGAARALPDAGRRAFLDGYFHRGDATAAPLPIYAALHCFLYAHQCVRHPQDADRYDGARAMLSACERVLEHGCDL